MPESPHALGSPTAGRQAGRLAAALGALVLLASCQPGDRAGEEGGAADGAAETIEAGAAGVRVVALPEVFEVSSNDDAGLTLAAPSLPGPSALTVTLSPRYEQGLNIVEAVELTMAEFAALPGGRSFGQTQLVAPLGLAYMARGRYQVDGESVEELRALLAHPWGNRLLTLSYIYPLGEDTSERGGQLMELLGEMEALEAPGEGASGAAGDEPVE